MERSDPRGPFPSEVIHDPDFEQLVADICRRPGIYVFPETFDAVCTYLDGFNAARHGGPLIGLHPWLVVRANGGNNLVWTALALQQLPLSPGETGDSAQIQALARLLTEFFEYRKANGITKVFHEYAKWLLRKKWYDGPLRQ
jgi:hypothetical protein